jgi:hypothetical protein
VQQNLAYNQIDILIGTLYVLSLIGLWARPMYHLLRHNRTARGLTAALAIAVLLTGCGGKTDIVTIEPNQTAFLIPISGDASQQQQMQSIDYLTKRQLASKQVQIPYSWRTTGYFLGFIPTGDFYPDDKLVLVDRTLVTREWTKSDKTGTSNSDQAFGVESSESIDFTIGATCTAIIQEDDAATFLYYFGSKSLADVMDSNVRGFIQSELFNEFGSRTLAEGQVDKKAIFTALNAKLTDTFKKQGITLLAFGGSEGMTYSDPKIQAAINSSYAAQQQVIQAQAQATQQSYTNQAMISQANAAATATVIAGAAQAAVMEQNGKILDTYPGLTGYTIAQKSSGQVPQILVIQGQQGTGNLPFTLMIPQPSAAAPTPTLTPTPH